MDAKPKSESPKHAKRSRWPAAVMAIVLLLPPAYVLSCGPCAVWYIASEPDPEEAWARGKVFEAVYAPVNWLCDHSETAYNWKRSYINWWVRKHARGVNG